MAEDNTDATPPGNGAQPPAPPPAPSKPDPKKLVSKQPTFSGFENVHNETTNHHYTIRVTLLPRTQWGKTIESFEKIAWTASVRHFMQILKTEDPDVLFIRKRSGGENGNPIAEESDIPDSIDLFTRDFAYNVRASAYHTTFHIGIASIYSFEELFVDKGKSVSHKLEAYNWTVVKDRVMKLGRSVLIGFLHGAHPKWVNQEKCLRELSQLLMDECEDIDLVPKTHFVKRKKQDDPTKTERVSVKTLAITCPMDISTKVAEKIMKNWSMIPGNPEFAGSGLKHYFFVPQHGDYYGKDKKGESWRQLLLSHREKNFRVAAALIRNCRSVDIEFTFCERMALAFDLNENEKAQILNKTTTIRAIFGALLTRNDPVENLVLQVEQTADDVVALLVKGKNAIRLRAIVFNFLEVIKERPDYLAISGGPEGAVTGNKFTSPAITTYMSKILGRHEPHLSRESYCGFNELSTNPPVRRPQLRISNGTNTNTRAYSDVVQTRPTTTSLMRASLNNASNSIVIGGSNTGMIRTQGQQPQATRFISSNATRAFQTFTSNVIQKEIARQSAGMTRALEDIRRDHRLNTQKLEEVSIHLKKGDGRMDTLEKGLSEVSTTTHSATVVLKDAMQMMMRLQDNMGKLEAERESRQAAAMVSPMEKDIDRSASKRSNGTVLQTPPKQRKLAPGEAMVLEVSQDSETTPLVEDVMDGDEDVEDDKDGDRKMAAREMIDLEGESFTMSQLEEVITSTHAATQSNGQDTPMTGGADMGKGP